MDFFWESFQPAKADLEEFPRVKERACLAMMFDSNTSRVLETSELTGDDALAAWTKAIPEAGKRKITGTMHFLVCPRHGLTKLHNEQNLKYLPFKHESLLNMFKSLYVHKAFIHNIRHPKSLFYPIKTCVDGHECISMIFTIDAKHGCHTAMSITYFPASNQLYGLYVGWDPRTAMGEPDYSRIQEKLSAVQSFLPHPFPLMALFLELERHNRTDEVNAQLDDLELTIIQSTGPQAKSDSTNSKWHTSLLRKSDDDVELGLWGGGSATAAAVAARKGQHDPLKLVTQFQRLTRLKIGLETWARQIGHMEVAAKELPLMQNTLSPGAFVEEPEQYLQRMRERYLEFSSRCQSVMDGTQLAFQDANSEIQELATIARDDTKMSIEDGKQMKAIAVLGMLFLPGTLVSGFMDAPIYEWDGIGSWAFWAMTIPITIVVMTSYCIWTCVISPGRSIRGMKEGHS